MNTQLLNKHLNSYKNQLEANPEKSEIERAEREAIGLLINLKGRDKLLAMSEQEALELFSQLWAMRMWGNKEYKVNQIIEDNGFDHLKTELAELLFGEAPIEKRWERARDAIKGMGPAMRSELLCYTNPDKYILWNSRIRTGLAYLQVEGLPKYNYQLTGKKYEEISASAREIASEMTAMGFEDTSLMAVNYFIWEELQIEPVPEFLPELKKVKPASKLTKKESEFVHDDVRDAIRDIGEWLGFEAAIEKKVTKGSRVDAVWESTIGNMGRIIYVFEVQTKGSKDSLLMNLLQALSNPAVQGVVAVSDEKQLKDIRERAATIKDLSDKLRVWNYEEVLKVHQSLEFVNDSINNLKLVPDGF